MCRLSLSSLTFCTNGLALSAPTPKEAKRARSWSRFASALSCSSTTCIPPGTCCASAAPESRQRSSGRMCDTWPGRRRERPISRVVRYCVCSTCTRTSYTIDSRSRTLCTRRRYCRLRSHALSSIVVLRPCGWVSLRLWNAGGLTCPHCLRRPSYASARALKQHDRRASLSLSYSVCSDRRCP